MLLSQLCPYHLTSVLVSLIPLSYWCHCITISLKSSSLSSWYHLWVLYAIVFYLYGYTVLCDRKAHMHCKQNVNKLVLWVNSLVFFQGKSYLHICNQNKQIFCFTDSKLAVYSNNIEPWKKWTRCLIVCKFLRERVELTK